MSCIVCWNVAQAQAYNLIDYIQTISLWVMKESGKNCIAWYCLQLCLQINVLHFLWSTAALCSSNSFNIVMYFHTSLKTPRSFLNCLTEIGLVDELRLCSTTTHFLKHVVLYHNHVETWQQCIPRFQNNIYICVYIYIYVSIFMTFATQKR